MPDRPYSLTTSKYDLFSFRGGYKVYVTDYLVARRVNRLLQEYVDYSFKEGDEAVFNFPANRLNEVKKALGVKG